MAHRVNEQGRLSVTQTTVLALPPPNQAKVSTTEGGVYLFIQKFHFGNNHRIVSQI